MKPRTAPVVLVVEDNEAMRSLIRSLVEEVTSMVHECDSGEDALELYARLRPDCVLMDIRLGGMDGITATRSILRIDPGARVIMVTENDGRRMRAEARAAGARGFVLKANLLELPALIASCPAPDRGDEGS